MTATPRPLRWGIVATGGMAAAFAADLRCVPADAELVAVASRDAERARAFAARFGIAHAFSSVADLLASNVDIVYIATPHSDHATTARAALAAGKHVLCEKPLTPDFATTSALIDAAAASGCFLMEAVCMRCNPIIRLAADLVHSGQLGDLRHVRASFAIAANVADDHRLLSPALAGGAILDLGVYPAHLIELLLRRPASVHASGRMAHTGVDASSVAVFDYAGQAQAVAFAALDVAAEQHAELVGTKGRIVIDGFVRPHGLRFVPTHGDPREYVAQLPGGGYTFEIDEVTRCVRAGETQSSLVDWEATRNVAAMLEGWRHALDHAGGVIDLEAKCR